MQKKGDLQKMLVVLILFAAVALVLLNFTANAGTKSKETTDIERCKLTALAQSTELKLSVTGSTSIASLDCPRRRLNILKNAVEVNGKKNSQYKFQDKSKGPTSDEFNKIAAEEMRLCWYKMLEGKKYIFENAAFYSDGYSGCLICSEIKFDSALDGTSYSGLTDFLKNNNIPRAETSYYDYLGLNRLFIRLSNGVGVDLAGKDLSEIKDENTKKLLEKYYISPIKENIVAGKYYSVYFYAYKPAWLDEGTGHLESYYTIKFNEQDTVNSQCEFLIN